MNISPTPPRDRRFLPHCAGALLLAVLLAASLGACKKKPDVVAPANVTNFTAVSGDAQAVLAWTNPGDTDFTGVLIKRKLGGYSESPTDGETVLDDTSTTLADTGLENGKTYYYTAFSHDAALNYSPGVQAAALPTSNAASPNILVGYSDTRDALDGEPGGALPDAEAAALAEILGRSEEAYRAGDPCGAAGILREYEEAAQTGRGGSADVAARGVYEELYNLGRRLRYDMRAPGSPCDGESRVGLEALALVDEQTSDNTGLETEISFGEPKVQTILAGGEVFTRMDIPGADADTGRPGFPAVPILRRLVAVPEGAEVIPEVTVHAGETIAANLAPAQFQPVDQSRQDQDPSGPPDPQTFQDPVFTKDPEIYAADRPWPPNAVSVSPAGRSRDVNYHIIEVASGQYNPASGELTLFDRVDVKISFKGGRGFFATEVMDSPFESRPDVFTGAALNGSAILGHLGPRGITPLITGEEFMILTHPNFRAAADALAAWKNEKGIMTRVFEVGGGTDYATNTAIAGLIKDEYENSMIRPSYALLLGDAEFIPTWYITANQPGLVGSATIGTDYRYASFTGVLAGVFPDIAVGRIPVDSLNDANTVVNKIINYEKTPPGFANSAFYSNAAIAAQFQCCRKDTAQAGLDQRTFIEVSEFARNVMNARGKTVQRIYTETVDGGCADCTPPSAAYTGDSTPRKYFDGTALPADLAPGGGFAWSGGNADIVNAWNAGRFLFIHRDHGWPGGWGNPPFSWADASALTNGALLPVVFSVNCASGLFDNETAGGALGSVANATYFAERLLINPNGGAVGVLGDTRNSPSWANSALMRGFIDAIWPAAVPGFGGDKSKRRLGDILNHAKLYLFTQAGVEGTGVSWADTGDELRLWNCLGDPTLELWTAFPYTLTIPVPSKVLYLNGVLNITHSVEGAVITATQPTRLGGPRAVGRAVVKGGTAVMEFFQEPNLQSPIQYAVNLDDSVSVAAELETEFTN